MDAKSVEKDTSAALIRPSLMGTDDVEALTAQYRIFSSTVLLKWVKAVKGTHREAIAAVLRERGYPV